LRYVEPESDLQTQTYTAIVHREDRWYLPECPEAGVVSQSHAIEDALRISKKPLSSISRSFLHGCPGRKPFACSKNRVSFRYARKAETLF
jgi:hypothetical protein